MLSLAVHKVTNGIESVKSEGEVTALRCHSDVFHKYEGESKSKGNF